MLALLLAAALQAEAPPEQAPAPAVEGFDQVKKSVIDAIRNCPVSKEGEVAVCAPDKGYSQRYRIEKMADRYLDAAEAAKRPSIIVEEAPLDQCGPIGQAGAMGCTLAQAKAWAEEKKRRKAAGEYVPW